MSQLLGRPVLAYRYLRIQNNNHSGRKEAFFELISLQSSMDDLKPNEKWSGVEQLSGMQSDQYGIINEYSLEAESEYVPKYRQPWEHSGWYSKATSWIEDSLQRLGFQLTEPPEQVKWWSLSCVLRLITTHGIVYFKTNAKQPLFTQEAAFLTYLAGILPDSVPNILASEPDEGWMLLADAGEKLSSDATVELRIKLLRTFGKIQLEMVSRTAELIQLGCANRKPEKLLPLVDLLLDDELVVSKLTSEEIGDLRRQLPAISEMCKRISTYDVPSTLVHGDLHMGNVASSNGRIIFFDWTDACVAHPFMDMILIYQEKDPSIRTRLRDAYLELWTGFESTKRLQELWSLCEVVHAIYHTVSYQSILRHTEVRSRGELGRVPSFYLRSVLRYLK
ncbi:aminoglycoside phosphotransferase family protein [Paenibacillus qinlingensis]|nr:aminoglycoside phosphotransferase family protein [Paenibacillus qinlingensis]